MKPTSLHFIAAVALAAAAGSAYQVTLAPNEPTPDRAIRSGNVAHVECRKIGAAAGAPLPTVDPPELPSGRVVENHAAPQPSNGTFIQTFQKLAGHASPVAHAPHSHVPTDHGPADGDTKGGSTPVSPAFRTLQLAGNFPLPAALLAEPSPTKPKPDELNTPVELATRAIVDDFYRNLAERLPASPPADAATLAAGDAFGENIIIEPNPETNAIRSHADELYRTLFGDEAFGRKGMESRLEVRLPETSDKVFE